MRLRSSIIALPALLAIVPAASAADGEAVFKRNCAICHSLEPGKNRLGPSLDGIVNRPAGSAPGFAYSSANAQSGIVWTKDMLNTYLADPQATVPGTLMNFPGVKVAADRQALIDFLASGDDP